MLSRKTIELLIKVLIYYDGGEWYEPKERADIDIATLELEAALKELEATNASNDDIEIIKANLEFLQNAKDEIFTMFEEVRSNFDGSDYQQGEKNGLRIALSILGNVEMIDFNRGNSRAREGLGKNERISSLPSETI